MACLQTVSKDQLLHLDLEAPIKIGVRPISIDAHNGDSMKLYKRIMIFILSALLLPAIVYGTQPNYMQLKNMKFFEKIGRKLSQTTERVAHPIPKTRWTWICTTKGRCERRLANENVILQSFETCTVICSNVSLIWPIPTGKIKLMNLTVPVNPDQFTLMIADSPSAQIQEHLIEAFELMRADLRIQATSLHNTSIRNEFNHNFFQNVFVYVEVTGDPDPRLRLDTDESYELNVKPNTNRGNGYSVGIAVDVRATSFCGARHAFETLSQLVWFDPYLGSFLMLQEAFVKDSPEFKYRGLLLDTARNYFPVADIIRTIDAMATFKLNTFHWHATDYQSFPLQLSSVPQLSQYGAYDSKSIYTREDIQTVVKRARLRGIRVVIEIDTPAHVTTSWGQVNDLFAGVMVFPCKDSTSRVLNPLNDNVYYILEKVYAEILALTEVDDVFHLGGDEVETECWKPFINNTFKPMQLWMDFTVRAYQALARANGGEAPKLTLLWSSKLIDGNFADLDPNVFTIQVWGDSGSQQSRAIPTNDFQTVVSHVDKWYLDCGHGTDSCDHFNNWKKIYNHQPWGKVTRAQSPSVVGGEACLWTETVGPSALDFALWPRTAALAERLWSDPPTLANAKVAFRLNTHRHRLIGRGIGASPMWPRWCSENPYQCRH